MVVSQPAAVPLPSPRPATPLSWHSVLLTTAVSSWLNWSSARTGRVCGREGPGRPGRGGRGGAGPGVAGRSPAHGCQARCQVVRYLDCGRLHCWGYSGGVLWVEESPVAALQLTSLQLYFSRTLLPRLLHNQYNPKNRDTQSAFVLKPYFFSLFFGGGGGGCDTQPGVWASSLFSASTRQCARKLNCQSNILAISQMLSPRTASPRHI